MMRTTSLPAVPLALAFIVIAAPAAAQAPASALPADAAVAILVKDPAALLPYLEGKAGLLKEPAIQEVLRASEADWATLEKGFEEETGMALAEVLGTLEGPIGVAIFGEHVGDDSRPVEFAMSLGVKDDEKTRELWQRAWDRLEAGTSEQAETREDEIRGVPVRALIQKEEGTSAADGWIAQLGGRILVASSKERLEALILATRGEEIPSLAGRPDFARAMQHLGAAAEIACYVDIGRVMGAPSELDRKMMKAFGVEGLTSVTLGATIGPAGLTLGLYADLPAPRRGLMKLLAPEPRALDPDRFATSEAIQAGSLCVDFKELLPEILSFGARFIDGEDAPSPKDLLDMAKAQLGFDLQEDLFALLEAPVAIVDYPGEGGVASPSDTSLFAVRCRDRKRVSASLEALMAAGENFGGALEEKEYLGHTILTLSIEGLIEAEVPEGAEMPSPAFTITESHLLFSLGGTAPIERALRTLGKDVTPIATTPEYARAVEGLSPRRTMIGFARMGDVLAEVTRLAATLEQLEEELPEAVVAVLRKADPALWRRHVELLGASFTNDAEGLLALVRLVPPVATPGGR